MKNRLYCLCVLLIFTLLVVGIVKFVGYATYKETNTYNLEEIENGKYVIYQRTVSAIPAQNYEIATMSINGALVTVKGKVSFVFTEDEESYAIIERTHLVNGDTGTIYVSKDKVEYGATVTIGR